MKRRLGNIDDNLETSMITWKHRNSFENTTFNLVISELGWKHLNELGNIIMTQISSYQPITK